jgi:hypothetical protein
MRVYYRTGRRTAVPLPWWLALPVYLLWASVMLLYLLGLALRFVVPLVARETAAWRRRRAENCPPSTEPRPQRPCQ